MKRINDRTIAGTDASGGAGSQAELKTVSAQGADGTSVGTGRGAARSRGGGADAAGMTEASGPGAGRVLAETPRTQCARTVVGIADVGRIRGCASLRGVPWVPRL